MNYSCCLPLVVSVICCELKLQKVVGKGFKIAHLLTHPSMDDIFRGHSDSEFDCDCQE